MLLHILLVAEILATVVCIYGIYGEKIKLDLPIVGLILGVLILLEISNFFRLGGSFSLIIYVVLFLYCKWRFNSSTGEVFISLVLCMIVITSVQFVCSSIIKLFVANEYIRSTVSNMFVLIIISMRFMQYGLYNLKKSLVRKSKFVVIILGFMCLIILGILLQGKVFYEIHLQYFVFVVPAIFMLLYSIVKWYSTQTKVENLEEEVRVTKDSKKNYDDLLTKIRLCQHGFKNHLTAILASHYTNKTYENLVQAQEVYSKKLLEENKYNDLLMLGDNILVGFLYGKFQEATSDEIEIKYKISAKVNNIQVPTYYLIEMLGILIDNSIDALKDFPEKNIIFEVYETNNAYEFLVKNPYRYVLYDEMTEWFEIDKSEKGRGRGLGLYHLKCLCDEWNCDIGCRNIEIDKHNWVMFMLKVNKADSM